MPDDDAALDEYAQLELERQLCFALYAASRAIVRTYGPLLDGVGLTYPQYVTLLALWDGGPTAPTVGALGDRLHLDSGTLTPVLKRLEALGHVRRRRDPGDERRVLIDLTDEGLALRDQVASVPDAVFSRLDLGVEEARRLRGLLMELTAALESDALPSTPRA